ncbi:hypothetical protein [Phyllobacterium chamaecytisi]|uniref:hypothetical protein n=1 Tax=Phyllobacterium chamaecytisi TaxID=2876082 RepID=UPI001CC99B3D|nr:hypothetical protein [Phyllobacterium sp. KW56]MBZ9600500.1 hypothetical protein [Phyllobacterium sp. KW56]
MDTSGYPVIPSTGDLGVPKDSTNLDPYKDGDIVRGTVSSNDVPFGLGATAIIDGQELAFNRLWLAYGRLGNKQKSREAFLSINPDADLAQRMVERAKSWALSAKPGQKRMPLEKWLAAEKYDEADRAAPANSNKPSYGKLILPTLTQEMRITGYAESRANVELGLQYMDGDREGEVIQYTMETKSSACVQFKKHAGDSPIGMPILAMNLPGGGLGFGRSSVRAA